MKAVRGIIANPVFQLIDVVYALNPIARGAWVVWKLVRNVIWSFAGIVGHLRNVPVKIKCFAVAVHESPHTFANGTGVERYSV